MKKIIIITICALLITTLYSNENIRVKRYAILVGANDGGDERAILRYAESDAKMVAKVLSDIGGIDSTNSILLLNPNLESLEKSFIKIKGIMDENEESVRTELIFYYSGHSDEEGLLMREDHFYYKDLKNSIKNTGADVKIGILDSCSSGAFTRLKGGKHNAPFLIDESIKTEGHAFITSAAEDEAAQESNRLQASFFTHFLVSALRGAADSSADGKVTLHEAYSYASNETLARTERTQAGAQHASYDFRLSGSGDIVLTDLRDAESSLILIEEDFGRFFIRDSEDNLISEVNKKHGSNLTISVPSSKYTVIKEVDGNYSKQEITLLSGENREVKIYRYTSFIPESNVVRGHSKEYIEYSLNVPESTAIFGWSQREKLRTAKGDFHFLSKARELEGYQISLANLVANDVNGGQLGLFLNVGGGDFSGLQASTFFNVVGGNIENYGLQFSSLYNWVSHGSESLAIQGSGLFNKIGSDTEGLTIQLSGLFNTIGGNAHSLTTQITGLYNISGNLPGFQLSGLFNVAKNLKGSQISGIVNKSDELRGLQISGIVNTSDDVYGAQISLINTADFVYGTQIGLININKDIKGLSIGLINISTEGIKNLSYHYDNTNDDHYLNYQFGSSILYHLVYVGLPQNIENIDKFSLGFGGGIHIPIWEVYTEIDFSIKSKFNYTDDVDYLDSFPILRAKIGLPLWDEVAIYIGTEFEFPRITESEDVDYNTYYNDYSSSFYFGFRI